MKIVMRSPVNSQIGSIPPKDVQSPISTRKIETELATEKQAVGERREGRRLGGRVESDGAGGRDRKRKGWEGQREEMREIQMDCESVFTLCRRIRYRSTGETETECDRGKNGRWRNVRKDDRKSNKERERNMERGIRSHLVSKDSPQVDDDSAGDANLRHMIGVPFIFTTVRRAI